VEGDRSRHAVFHDTDRERFFGLTRNFLARHFARRPERTIDAVHSYTRRAYEKLTRPRPWYCAKGLAYRANRLFLGSIGRTSDGIRLGWQAGFNSGRSLDYVYRDEACGKTPLGRLIDRFYLSAVGWRGIRQRKRHLHDLLRRAITEQRARGRTVHIMDIAAGPGRYILELLREDSATGGRESEISATLRDRDQAALDEGKALAREMGVANVRYEAGDAFSRQDLSRIQPRPTIAAVSGLYEIFEDNALIESSLWGLAAAVQPGDYLIYTNQPWHPQLELIARTLTGPDQKPWVMRCRTQKEMDYLVEEAGFEKLDMLIDQWGIFTVSLSRRRP
jgi:hypothetical protein